MTNDPSDGNINTGYATDQSQTRRRRSSRASSLVVVPNMVAPSSDSRVKVTRPATHKRPTVAETSSESGSVKEVQSESDQDSVQTDAIDPKGKPNTKKRKQRQEKPSSSKKKKTAPPPQRKGKSKKGKSLESGKEPAYNYDQDTDEGSITIQSREPPKAKKKDKYPIEDFFYPPFWKEGDKEGLLLNYKCCWCEVVYRKGEHTNGNLVSHRDGFTQGGKSDRGCRGRAKAIAAGVDLPLSVAEQRKLANLTSNSHKQPAISQFLQAQPLFVNRVLNQIIMIWQIRQALAWSRIEDPYLRAAFRYANSKATLYSRRWSATEAKKMYSMLKSEVFKELNVSCDLAF
ncbi:hypothetical protein PGT21_026273 [Puccinia graminis f. sp. tritici]|uniref:Uncharacterized protein n=1 Tax=Puccinia graminis f. sp. tritici TaxID=56615 RepID=A0A5B0PUN2_PUCGR|nr:hypothetical protein PGT21_026273 [Puccinia graminis f. sp. tritici]